MESQIISQSNWFVALTRHYAGAFAIANQFAERGGKSLEIAALGAQGLLIVDLKNKISDSEKKSLSKSFSIEAEQQIFIDDLSEKVIKSYLSLENAKIEKYLLFFEFPFLGEALKCAQEAVGRNLKIVELRFIRSSTSVTHLILTGDDEKTGQDYAQKYVTFNSRFLSSPTDEIKKYFEIFPA